MNPLPSSLPPLLALTCDAWAEPHSVQVERMLEAGVSFIQFRSKKLAGGELRREAFRSAELARERGALLVINDCPVLAAESRAGGVHLGMEDGSSVEARRILGDQALIGRTVHSAAEAEMVRQERDCDYVGLGPIRASRTKTDLDLVLEEEEILCITAALSPVPVFLIGGLASGDFDLVPRLGVAGLAVCSALSETNCFGRNLAAFVARAKAIEREEVVT